jgi:HAD superfamily hydrolase (TIGR01549 family)
MSGGLFARAVAREAGRALTDPEAESIQQRHGALFRELMPERRRLPGARELLAFLRDEGVPHGIATSGRRPEIDASLEVLGVPPEMIVVERGDVLRAKPEPDLFLACQERLGVRDPRLLCRRRCGLGPARRTAGGDAQRRLADRRLRRG